MLQDVFHTHLVLLPFSAPLFVWYNVVRFLVQVRVKELCDEVEDACSRGMETVQQLLWRNHQCTGYQVLNTPGNNFHIYTNTYIVSVNIIGNERCMYESAGEERSAHTVLFIIFYHCRLRVADGS